MIPAEYAPAPRVLWVELTSKCPADCVFCSRKLRRGAGEHLPFEIFDSLAASLVDARRIVLNYSGESTVYPDLIPAIQRARVTGAYVELVSVLVTAPESMIPGLAASGLNRLTVSVHASDQATYTEIYRYGSLETQKSRMKSFIEHCRQIEQPPIIDLSFVAMQRNLAQLGGVAKLAETLGLRRITIFPIMRRDNILIQFTAELSPDGVHRREFEEGVQHAVADAERTHPSVRITIGNAGFNGEEPQLGAVPTPYPRLLPEGAHVYSCEQNPWETAHVLANGDVVACEVLDKVPLGNLHTQSMSEIWHGAQYRQFRERYRRGEIDECRTCPWKRAYVPGAMAHEILGARGMNAQLLYGWHDPEQEGHIWSSQRAAAIIAPRPGANTLHVSGILPQRTPGHSNDLTIVVNGCEIGKVHNSGEEPLAFGLDFPAKHASPWIIQFRTTHVCRAGSDQRDLGFALTLLASKVCADAETIRLHRRRLEPLDNWIHRIDRWAWRVRARWTRRLPRPATCLDQPGISILIPERANAKELADCLAALRNSARPWHEPLEIIVLVNGSPASDYEALRSRYPEVKWHFVPAPLGFGGAVRAGLRNVHHEWVYLLNSDAVPDPEAIQKIASCRAPNVFSAASQIHLKDTTRFRDETNWGALLIEDGLAAIHDWIPQSDRIVPGFYSGGGASLFQTRLLRKFVDERAYAPFYWEDVEWGWRARKLGYESVFCPASTVQHTRRATIGKLYSQDEIERILERNRLLFQLRNFTTAGSLDAVLDEIARWPDLVFARAVRWRIARARLWNHMAPLSDEEVMECWIRSISSL